MKEFVSQKAGGASGLNYAPLESGDWGILEFGEISIFFQLTPIDQTVPKRSFWAFDKNVAATMLFSFLLQAGLIGSTVFLWDETAVKAESTDIRKLMKVEVQVSEEEEEEEIIEDGEEEDDAGYGLPSDVDEWDPWSDHYPERRRRRGYATLDKLVPVSVHRGQSNS